MLLDCTKIAGLGRLTMAVSIAGALIAACCGSLAHADTLDDILKRQRLVCGVSEGLAGFSTKDSNGQWRGLDVDFCRALSAAIFGLTDRVDFVPLSAEARFEALKTSKIDVLSRNSTWTMSRDVGQRFDFAGVYYFDGQSFMTPTERGWVSAMELSGIRVCVQSGTTSEANAVAFFAQHSLQNDVVKHPTLAAALAAYASGACEAFTADRSALAVERLGFDQPDAHVVLPEVISKEPLGPVVRKGDPDWADVVRWVLFALINAEEEGHSREKFAKSKPAPNAVPALSSRLPRDWYEKVVSLVGNYGEIFERNLGKDTPLGIERGANALWTQGGLLYAPPLR